MSEDTHLNVTFKELSAPVTRKSHRTLETIEMDIHAITRRTVFQLGRYLTEAKSLCGDQEWSKWIDKDLDMHKETAANYMAAWRFVSKFRKARSFNVAARVITAAAWLDKTSQARAVEVLANASTKKSISAPKGYKLLELVKREAFLRAAKRASRLAGYDGPFDKVVTTATRQAALAWTRLAAVDDLDDESSNPLVAWWEMATADQRAEFARHVRKRPKAITRITSVRRKLPPRQRSVARKRARG